MPRATIHRRHLQSQVIGNSVCIAATRNGDFGLLSFLKGADVAQIQKALGKELTSARQVGGGVQAKIPETGIAALEESEFNLLANRRVLLAIRNGETAKAAHDWLKHYERFDVTGALIFDRSPPERANEFADALSVQLQNSDIDASIVVVTSDQPMGHSTHNDARNPAMAPGAPPHVRAKQLEKTSWHAPFSQPVLIEALRHRFLGGARSVAFFDIADVLLPEIAAPDPFARAEADEAAIVELIGQEIYPWNLKKTKPAQFADHRYVRQQEPRRIHRWCANLNKLENTALVHPTRNPESAREPNATPSFVRAMGVVFPGAPVSQLVDKADLIDITDILPSFENVFPGPTAAANSSGSNGLKEPPTDHVVVVSAMKNEGPFLIDWIAHNRAIGVDDFLIYTNDCSDGTDALLDALARSGVVTHRKNPFRETGGVPQHAAFRAAEKEKIFQDAGWLLTLDVDEYMNIRAGRGCLSDLFAAVPDANVISMPWRLFGSGDLDHFIDQPVVEQFQHCATEYSPRPHQAWGMKTIYRNAGIFRKLGVHRPKGLEPGTAQHIRWVDGSGRDFPSDMWKSAWRMTTKTWGYDLCSINHYAVRSAESFLIKRDRGRVNHVARDQGKAYWFRMNHNAEQDSSIRRLDDLVASEKSKLLALPGVRDLHDKAVHWHKTRIKELLQKDDYLLLYNEITGSRLKALSRILTRFGSNVFLAGPDVIPDEVLNRPANDEWSFTINSAERLD